MAVQMTRGDDSLVFGPIDEYGMPSIAWLEETLKSDSEKVSDLGKIKMVTIVNPGNPTGVSLPFDHLKRIVDLCGKYGVWVVMDNTYEQFDHIRANSYPIDDSDNIAGYHCFHDEHVVNIFSFSKGYAMAGFRVGYVAVNSSDKKGRNAYEQMLKVQDTIPICASRISQTAALGSLSVGRGWVSEKVKTLERGRNAILKALSPLEETIGGTGAMYVMAKLPDGKNDMSIAEELVENHGVVVIPGSFCGFPGWIRVCYSNLSPDACTIAAGRLARGIAELCQN